MKLRQAFFVVVALVFLVSFTKTVSNVSTENQRAAVGDIANPQRVDKIFLVNPVTGTDIAELVEGYNIDTTALGLSQFTFRAETTPGSVGSVVLQLNQNSSTDNLAPYLFGSSSLSSGENFITATPFSQNRARGTVGTAKTVNFSVSGGQTGQGSGHDTDTSPIPAGPTSPSDEGSNHDTPNQEGLAVLSYTLVNTDTNQDIRNISNGDVIDLSQTGQNITIRANTTILPDLPGSVKFNLNGNNFVENLWPFTISPGNSTDDYLPWNYAPGESYTLQAQPFTQRRARGDAGQSLEVSFSVSGSASTQVDSGSSNRGPSVNGVTVSAPAVGTTLYTSQSFPMTCDVTTISGYTVWKLVYAWNQYLPGTDGQAGSFVVMEPVSYSTGSYTQNVTIPGTAQNGPFNLQCIAYYYDGGSNWSVSANDSIAVNVDGLTNSNPTTSISITTPTEGGNVITNQNFTVSVAGSPSSDQIQEVRLYYVDNLSAGVDGGQYATLLGTDTTAPFSISANVGDNRGAWCTYIYAEATLNDGSVLTTNPPVKVVVTNSAANPNVSPSATYCNKASDNSLFKITGPSYAAANDPGIPQGTTFPLKVLTTASLEGATIDYVYYRILGGNLAQDGYWTQNFSQKITTAPYLVTVASAPPPGNFGHPYFTNIVQAFVYYSNGKVLYATVPIKITPSTQLPSITTLQLVSAQGQILRTLSSGDTVNIGSQSGGIGSAVAIKANPASGTSPASVKFEIQSTGTPYTHIENTYPYSSHGDTGGANPTYNLWSDIAPGPYTVIVTPYTAANATGTAGPALTIPFVVVNNDDTTPPTPPSSVSTTYRSSGEIRIAWSGPTDAVDYKVYRTPGGVTPLLGNVTSYVDTSVTGTGAYSYSVSALDAAGNESGLSTTTIPPTLPTTFALNSLVELNTTTSAKTAPDGTNQSPQQQAGAQGTIIGGPVYYQGIFYWNVNFTTNPDGWVNGNFLEAPSDVTPPNTPSGLSVLSTTTNSVDLDWTDSVDQGSPTTPPVTYKVYRSATSNGTYAQVGTSSTSAYTNTGLQPNTIYYYKVSALDSANPANESAKSSAISGTTQGTSGQPTVYTPQRSLVPSQLAVVVNSDNPISSQIASYYANKYGIPSGNIISVSLGDVDMVTSSTFGSARTSILNQIGSGIQAMAFAGEKPFTVRNNSSDSCTSSSHSCMSITSALAMGYSTSNTGGGTITSTNYYDSNSVTPRTTYSYIPTMMLAGRTLQEAQGFIDNGFAANSAYPDPSGGAYAIQTTDHYRSDARRTDMTSVVPSMFVSGNQPTGSLVDNYCAYSGCGNYQYAGYTGNYITGQSVIGYHTGADWVPDITNNTIKPGAIAEHVTSFGGFLKDSDGAVLPGGYRKNDYDQMPITQWLEDGFVASAGTVQEPWCCDSTGGLGAKFPVVSKLWGNYYTGASALESYAKAVQRPGQTLFVGDPLTNPWKEPQISFSANTLTISLTHIKPGEVWKLQSSTDGSSWSDVSGQTNITSPSGKYGLKTITVSNATAPYYRLVNTNVPGLPQVQRSIDGVTPPGQQTAPSAPTSSSASNVATSSFTANWSASSGATGYYLDVSSSSSFSSFLLGFNNKDVGNVTNYNVTGLTAGTTYYYRVRAYNSIGTSSSSATQTVQTSQAPSGGQVLGLNGNVGPSTTNNVSVEANPYGAPDYFLSCVTGSDSNDGRSVSTPWASLSKLDTLKYGMSAGTRIFFQRGCTFRGSLAPWSGAGTATIYAGSSGTASQPIEYLAYGSGSAPVISGGTLATGWTVDSGNIYKTNIGANKTIKYLTVGGAKQTLARTPNTGWYRTDSQSSMSITDQEMPSSSTTSLTGASVVWRTTSWSYGKYPVTAHNNKTITLGPGENNQSNTYCYYPDCSSDFNNSGWGWFAENKRELLDTAGEWYYNKNTGDLYLWAPGGQNPNNLTVEASTADYGIWLGYQKQYIKVKDLVFANFNKYGVFADDARNATIDHTEIRNAWKAVHNYETPSLSVSLANQFTNNYIHDVYFEAMFSQGNGILIQGNVFENVGVDPSAGANDSNWGYFGINASNYNLIKRNIVRNAGYISIVAGSNSVIEENYVEAPLKILNDGGAIAFDNTDGLIVRNNVIKDVIGEITSMSSGFVHYYPISHAIYFGQYTNKNDVIENNTIINSTAAGIWVDNSYDSTNNTIRNNTLYNTGSHGLGFSDFSTWTDPDCPSCFVSNFNHQIYGNKIYAADANQQTVYMLQVRTNQSGGYADFGSFYGNYFYNPFNASNLTQYLHYSGQNYNRTLSQFQSTFNEPPPGSAQNTTQNYTLSSASQMPPLYYNNTASAVTVSIGSGKCDKDGNTLPTSYTLQAFSSIVPEDCSLQ